MNALGAESCGARPLPTTCRLARGAHRLSAGTPHERLAAPLAVRRSERQAAEPRDVAARVVADLPERGVLDLANALARDAHVRADFLERHSGRVLADGSLRGVVSVPLEVGPRIGDVRRSATAALLRRSDRRDDRQQASDSQARYAESNDWRSRDDYRSRDADSQARLRSGNGNRSGAVQKLRLSDSVPHGTVLPPDPVWVLGAANNVLLIFVFAEASRVREGTRLT